MMPAATVSLVVPSITSNVNAMYILSNHYLIIYYHFIPISHVDNCIYIVCVCCYFDYKYLSSLILVLPKTWVKCGQ